MTEFSNEELKKEIERLVSRGLRTFCGEEDLRTMAGLTLKINRLKQEKNAVIPGHVYQRPEILQGVADFTGDSYRLARLCAETKDESIVFCGVRFMAETAKILNPEKEVYLPSPDAGCSLAESITAADVRQLKKNHPGVPVISYINTTAEVKAESDCIVTSANALKILRRFYEKNERVIFLPDRLMGANLAKELGKTPGKEIVFWKGTCIVHEGFDPRSVAFYRKTYPGVKVLAHAECEPALVEAVDFIGGTGDMMRYVKETAASAYMLVTECGLGELARITFPDKDFIPMCRLCPYMKVTTLETILETLENPRPVQKIKVDINTALRAKSAIEKMFELAEGL
ncbi:MAG: quinolinate synthase NadA [bacterium]